jgi:hypothetical protein
MRFSAQKANGLRHIPSYKLQTAVSQDHQIVGVVVIPFHRSCDQGEVGIGVQVRAESSVGFVGGELDI